MPQISFIPTLKVNRTVKSYILSESFLWSAWNFVIPLIAVFASTELPGGNVKIAALLLSISFWERTVCELFIGKFVKKDSVYHKLLFTIAGLSLITLAYIGFAFTSSLFSLTIYFSFLGLGWGIASPIKNSIFTVNLDKNNETFEVGLYDAVTLVGMAISVALGGIIAYSYGFKILFLIAAGINIISIIPYILVLNVKKREQFDFNYNKQMEKTYENKI